MKGRLKERLEFWQSIIASRLVLEMLKDGYSLPFISLPERVFLAIIIVLLKMKEMLKLLSSGA